MASKKKEDSHVDIQNNDVLIDKCRLSVEKHYLKDETNLQLRGERCNEELSFVDNGTLAGQRILI